MGGGTTQKAGWLTNEDYDFIYARVPRLCVDLVIKNKQNETLLSLRDIEPHKGKWHLPGGRVGFEESLESAIQRVAKAEVGVEVTIQKMIGFMEFPDEVQDSKKRHTVSIVFLVEVDSEGLQGSWQAKKVEFFKTLPENIHPTHGQFLSSL